MLRSRVTLFLLLALATSGLLEPARATDVSGNLTTQTWTKANSPYRVVGAISVPAGNTLTVDPGVDVVFDANVPFLVRGRLLALGTATDSVRFLPGNSPWWRGVRFGLGDSSSLAYVRISGAIPWGTEPEKTGGGLCVLGTGTRVGVAHSAITGNSSTRGAGVYNNRGRVSISNSSILGNDGPGVQNDTGAVTLENCVLFDNRGDAVCNPYGTAVVSACMIAYNSGTGVSVTRGNLEVRNSTVAANGGGIASTLSTTTVHNSIIWGNGGAAQVNNYALGTVTVGYSDIQSSSGVYPGTGNINAEPQFADPANQIFRLWPGSPCIDAGDPASPLDPDGSRADIGAGTVFRLSGTMSTMTWFKTRSPYRVLGTLTIPSGNTLTIEPGVDILFDSTAQIFVSGRIFAIGTEADSIRFLKGTTDWRGIRISGGDSSTLAYVRISGSLSTVFSGPNGAGIGLTGANTRLGVAHSVISGNQNGMSGGGIAVGDSARLTMVRCAIRDNYCYYAGGGILNNGFTLLSECLISGNVPSGLYYGGGIYNTGTLVAKGCTITANRAGNGGAGIYNEPGGTVEIDSSVISSNRAGIAGGGFGNYGTMRVTRCLVINNLANADWPEGAGGRNGGSLYVANCTFYGNSGGSGNGITHSGGTTELLNTIIWGNAAPQLKGFDQPGVTVTYSNIQQDAGVFPGTGNINADPQFSDPANQDFRLWPGSPCIDAGDPASVPDPDGSPADMGGAGVYALSGDITTTTWTKARSPYRVTGSITVPVGNTLTIEPGVDVLFDADVRFQVRGRLVATGTETDSIRFLPGSATQWGGIRISGGDSSTITFTRISGGNARGGVTGIDDCGGGLSIGGSGTRVGVSSSVLADNSASAAGGGAHVFAGAGLTMDRCSISRGRAGSDGSGVSVAATSTLSLKDCTVTDNIHADFGGGIANRGNLRVADSHIEGNGGINGGGIANMGTGTASIVGSRVQRNGAHGGGGIDNQGGTLYMRNCSICANWVAFPDCCGPTGGGGGLRNSGFVTLENCTVGGNAGAVGAIENKLATSTLVLRNGIVWGNDEPALSIWRNPANVTATFSNIQGDTLWAGTGNINADPLFVDAANGDLHLQPGSPCIDAGDPASPMDPDWSRTDMGAFPFFKTGTTVAGEIATGTWTNAASPYRVTGAVTVPSGATLTMEPGVAVLFDSTAPFLVKGALRAIGTEADSIRFLRGAAADWRGLRFSGGDSSALAFVRVSGGYARGETREDSCGGGFHLSGAGTRVTVSRSVIRGNASAWSGAGIKGTAGAKGVFTDCVITDNHAEHDGGGLYNTELADITFADCIISRNTAGDDGGGMDNSNGIITLTGCTVTHNTAFDDAGGIGNHGTQGRATITRCVIAKNMCGVDGGGLRPTGGAVLTMTNCTVADNVSANGGGLYNESNAVNTLLNCILWGNTTPGIFNQSGTVGAQYSCIAGAWGGIGNIASNPLFVDAANDDYRLLNSSPCVDTGDPASPLDPDGSRANMGACPARREVGVTHEPRPVAFELSQNAPNPFNPSTTLRFVLPEAQHVILVVYDVRGARVCTLVDRPLPAGIHSVMWDGYDSNGRAVASGVYICRLTAANGVATRRMVLVR